MLLIPFALEPDDSLFLRISAENNLSETAFVQVLVFLLCIDRAENVGGLCRRSVMQVAMPSLEVCLQA